MTFQDGRHSILSLVCLALLCSVFKVRFQVKTWIKYSNFEYLIQILTVKSEKWRVKSFGVSSADNITFAPQISFTEKFFLLLTRSQPPHVRRHLQGATTMLKQKMVGLNGLEPSTSRLSGGRSNLLSYKPKLVEIIGIEPMTPCLQSRCSPSWAIPPWFFFGLPYSLLRFTPEPQKLNNDIT